MREKREGLSDSWFFFFVCFICHFRVSDVIILSLLHFVYCLHLVLPHNISFPQATLHIGDGLAFVREHPGEFDVIITDSSDPIGKRLEASTW